MENLTKTKTGVTAESHFAKDEFVFFSIPWESGWSATIDGEAVDLEKVNVGFMGLAVPAGDHEIVLHYETPGLKAGAIATFGGTAALAAYWWLAVRYDKKRETVIVEGMEDEKI